MTIRQAIAEADMLAPNDIPADTKTEWLSRLDGRLAEEIFAPRGREIPSPVYDPDDPDKELAVTGPYSSLYVYMLTSEIYLAQQQTEKYNTAYALFGQALAGFRNSFAASNRRTRSTMITF